ncbi:armadillo repeat-containing protein 3 isoform X2 [Pelodiscus sinensis]|uniref:Armadillo repeat containing 3 n=1 Tax=Pelodiscus sinensis TaxID=13735 RepID=K7FG84_PELSI|nr:armadillo repeat-containing protein 3 isoform X1 [Pelodiscus sinensis]XP_006119591.1 armadillo repeat-containing protein 3 isoform X1 [Pelodiscus sinensis]XP_006119592.1 armadillo repeat-containing protein 3 isoform X1 [Pelodiscus sinensis]XP_025038625.1 armadillo repeat-containing protein 3 isoform X1 [Pelodiscus sinensis]XP_025038626.1 armadillo repeat-containing protein 3 isoform X1 [Pelodiscus sinensis]XP_025038627.1 armadillo repeat-containing protein 3 isoform X1 [Pelodiscus sinensis]|eukprot:XP_006119589.1 armadillo repeat-containing protein 3 isoform X1 [Pelodiscus sinensis]
MGKKVKKEVEPPPKDVFDPLSIESKKAATVVLMLNSPEEEVLAKACESIYKFASKGDENKVTLLGLGAVEPLFKLISHEDPLVRRNATMVFGIMASNNDIRKLLRELDVTNSVIARLAPEEDIIVHEFASLCLAHMAVEYTSKVQIFEQGGLEPLIRLLSSPDPDVKKNSVECIYHLVQDFQSRAAVRELNAIPPLLELLKSEYPVVQLLALKTFGVISNDRETRVILRENQGLDHLFKILETKEFNDLHVEALAVVANCLDDVDTMQLIQQTGGLKKLLSFAEVSAIPDIQKNAAKAIAKAAYDPENRRILHEEEVEKCLVNLLGTDNDGTKAAASQAISAMCENLASKDAFGNQGIPQLVQLLSSDNEEVKEAAAIALANLTTASPTNVSAVAEAEGIEPLINVLSAKRDGTIANATTALTNMATQEPLRLKIQNHGVMNAIVEPLQSTNSLVQSKAALTVAALGCDADARTELRNANGLEPLVKLLHSKNDEVRRNACWAVMVCASDELTAVELCRVGALDILEEINLSTGRKNNFSEGALDKLLDNNLSQKYSQMGYLSSSNIITDGFFDYGQVKPGVKLLSLEELCTQELNDRRAIILVNAKLPEVSLSAEDKSQELCSGRTTSSSSFRKSSKERTSSVVSPVEEKQEASGRSPSSLTKSSTREKGSRKGKGKKEEERPKEEEELQTMLKVQEVVLEKLPWLPPFDSILLDYIIDASKIILPLTTTKEQVVALAQFVADKMGGPIERDKLHEFSWELHISEIEFELKCNVVPIGKIKKGTFYHRALLFKVIADRIGIGCSLVRGEYGRAWNEVKLVDDSPQGITGLLLPPQVYIVDLMYQTGYLMKQKSAEADSYQRI